MISHSGKVVVRLERLQDEFARRADGSPSILLADTRFDNHHKMTITGVVQHGAARFDRSPFTDFSLITPPSKYAPAGYLSYYPSWEFDVIAGDQVWFHYLCAEEVNQRSRGAEGYWDVRMQASDIFCRARDGAMKMVSDWVLGTEIERKLDIVDVGGVPVQAELGPADGIQIVRGLVLAPMVDECMIYQIDPAMYRSVHEEVKAGDRVYLAKDSLFENVIRERRRYLFRHSDILAIHSPDPAHVRPVGFYHLVKVPNEYRYSTIKGIKTVKPPEWGEILASGKMCVSGAKVGDKVVFSRRWTRMLDASYWLIHDCEIQCSLQ